VSETAVLEALCAATPNRTEFSGRPSPADPDRSFAVLEKRKSILSGKLEEIGQLAVFPTGKPFRSADQKTPVACDEQASYIAAWEMLTRWWLPSEAPNAIEATQALTCAHPEITVWRLGNCGDRALEKAFADRPRLVRVLIDVERGV